MTVAGATLVDVYLSVAALMGLLVLHRELAGRGAGDPLTYRFLIALRVTGLLYLGRALVSLIGVSIFYTFILISAALIPIVVLILTEGLLRRHAPRWVKAAIAAGALIFGLWALVPIGPLEVHLLALMVFQAVSLITCGAIVLWRDRKSLSGAENTAVDRLGLSLLLLIPLAIVDFQNLTLGVPFQPSALAVLFLCLLALGLGSGAGRHRDTVTGFAIALIVAALATVCISFLFDFSLRDGAMVGAVVAASILVVQVITQARHQREEGLRVSLLRHLAQADGDALTFLRGLQDHPMVEGAALLDADMLADLDPKTLSDLFAAHPVLRRSDPCPEGHLGDYADHLFERYDASHVLWVSDRPLQLVALAMPAVTATSATELELAAVQRMAALLARD